MKFSKTVSYFSTLFLMTLSDSSSTKCLDVNPLLSPEDLIHEKNDREQGPALSSATNDPKQWETYNQWMCFDTSQIQLDSIDIKSDANWRPWPQITVTTVGQRFNISPETDLNINTEETLKNWRALLNDSKEICLYAAFLQYLDEDEMPDSLWVLEDVKTENGYWHVNDSIFNEDSD